MLTTSHTKQKFTVIVITILATLAIWLGSKWQANDWFTNPFKYPAKAASLGATVMFCWGFFLSARNRKIESYFGGLDKVYQIHKRLGKWSLPVIALHPIFLALDRLPDLPAFLGRLWFVLPRGDRYETGHNLGVAAFLLLLALLAPTLWVKVPYHRWKRCHEWFGLFLAVVIAHIVVVDRDIASYPLLRAWVYSLILLAAGSFIAIRFLYRHLGPRHDYRVADIERERDVLEITFAPVDRPMAFRPSQFVYLVISHEGITPEPHPYSIACGYNLDNRFKLGIKMTGDHTRSLRLLEPGDRVTVYGPYGRFSDRFLAADRHCVFIGGGIGITPFLGMWHVALHTENQRNLPAIPAPPEKWPADSWLTPLVSLFYLVPTADQASFDNDIRHEVILSQFQGFPTFDARGHQYELWIDSRQGFISAPIIDSRVSGGIRDRYIFLCGPTPMVSTLIGQFLEMGIPEEQIVIEDFNLY
jgi:predicted ferric reductase